MKDKVRKPSSAEYFQRRIFQKTNKQTNKVTFFSPSTGQDSTGLEVKSSNRVLWKLYWRFGYP